MEHARIAPYNSQTESHLEDASEFRLPPRISVSSSVSDIGEMLLKDGSRGGVWVANSPLIRAQTEVLAHMKEFLSDWKKWKPEETRDSNNFSFNSLYYTGSQTYLKQLVEPFVRGQPYCPEGKDFQVVLRVNNFPAGAKDQSYHDHRAPFASFIFNPEVPLGTPIYELTWGHGDNINCAQTDILASGSSYSIEDYSRVYHRVAALTDVFTVLVGVIPEGARPPHGKRNLMLNLGKNAKLFNAALKYFNPEDISKRMPDVDKMRAATRSTNRA